MKLNLIQDSLPYPDFIGLAGKFLGLVLVFLSLMVVLTGVGVIIQTLHGYFNFELGLYFKHFLTNMLPRLLLYSMLGFFMQVMVNNKFLGFAAMVVFYILQAVLSPIGLEHAMFSFSHDGLGRYSDMNGFGHYLLPFGWFELYWFGFALVLFAIATLLSVRGADALMKFRFRVGKQRLTKPMLAFAMLRGSPVVAD